MPGRNPVQIVQEQLTALRSLEKIARQPAALEVMRLIVYEHYGNGNGSARAETRRAVAQRRGAIWDTGIKEATLKILPTLSEEFTYREVLAALADDGYQVAAKNARSAVGKVLHTLLKEKTIKEVRKGIGGAATVYRRA